MGQPAPLASHPEPSPATVAGPCGPTGQRPESRGELRRPVLTGGEPFRWRGWCQRAHHAEPHRLGGWRWLGGVTNHTAMAARSPKKKEAPSSALTSTMAAASERKRGREARRSYWRRESRNGGVGGGMSLARQRRRSVARAVRAAAVAAFERAGVRNGGRSGGSR